jgi:hypothetical protein
MVILGIQAMVNGQVILPNYQVRYFKDFKELFKNSMPKTWLWLIMSYKERLAEAIKEEVVLQI